MPEPKPIQLALQGGGAKIFALIAALDAIDDHVRKQRVKVTRIAGTSAGALVGGLYAAGVPPSTMKEAFANIPLEEVLGFPAHKSGTWFNRARLLCKAWRNKPLADDAPLRRCLEKLLRDSLRLQDRSDPVQLSDLSIPVLLVASDVSARKRQDYDSLGDHRSMDAVECMMDSCALPFFFRPAASSSQSLILDGGLAENLPSDLLTPGKESGDVVAISFKEFTRETPKTAVSLALALLDTAISSSIRKAKSTRNVSVIELDPAKVGTFDFAKAQAILKGENPQPYRVAYEKTHLFIKEFYSARGRVVSNTRWESADAFVMDKLHRIYKAQQEPRPFPYLSRKLVVEANSLLSEGENDYGLRDRIEQTHQFAPGRYPIDSIVFVIFLDGEDRPSDVYTEAWDSNNRPVSFELVPVRDLSKENMYGLMVCFTPPLVNDGSGVSYTVRNEYRVKQSFPDLETTGRDEVETVILRTDVPVPTVDLIVHIPLSKKDIVISPKPSPHAPTRKLGLNELPHFGGFQVHGWRAENVLRDSRVGIFLQKAKSS